MKATIEEILKYPKKYVECRICGYVNWHGNKQCYMCDAKVFQPLTEPRIRCLEEASTFVGNKERPV